MKPLYGAHQRTGFLHPDYAQSLAQLGTPMVLSRSGGTVIIRRIPGTDHHDAMGCYPFFCAEDWRGLGEDLAELRRIAVSLVLVTEPFHAPGPNELRRHFLMVRPFKLHYAADLSVPLDGFVPASRLRKARRALRLLTITVEAGSESHVGDFLHLQKALARRHMLTGASQSTPEALGRLLSVPGMTVFTAKHDGNVVGMHIEAVGKGVVYGHLAAYCEFGYRLGAPTAIHVVELEYFSGRARYIDWGGIPGSDDAHASGLAEFKRSFSNITRQVYLCGAIFDRQVYQELSFARAADGTNYFPAYRLGEFTGGEASRSGNMS